MKTIIITGASGGLGTTVTQTFLQKGYKVIATVTSEASKKELPPHQNLEVEIVNLTDETATAHFVQQTLQANKIEAALLLVGGFTMGNLATTKTEVIRQQIALNFETAYNLAQPILLHMLEHNFGRLIFIGSRPALRAADGKNVVAYALSKSLLFTLAELINAEAKGKNVTATVIAPSTIDTPANRKNMPDANPDNWVKPKELAEILEFITSETGNALRETILKVYSNA